MAEFAKAALPWIIMGLGIAIFVVRSTQDKN